MTKAILLLFQTNLLQTSNACHVWFAKLFKCEKSVNYLVDNYFFNLCTLSNIKRIFNIYLESNDVNIGTLELNRIVSFL